MTWPAFPKGVNGLPVNDLRSLLAVQVPSNGGREANKEGRNRHWTETIYGYSRRSTLPCTEWPLGREVPGLQSRHGSKILLAISKSQPPGSGWGGAGEAWRESLAWGVVLLEEGLDPNWANVHCTKVGPGMDVSNHSRVCGGERQVLHRVCWVSIVKSHMHRTVCLFSKSWSVIYDPPQPWTCYWWRSERQRGKVLQRKKQKRSPWSSPLPFPCHNPEGLAFWAVLDLGIMWIQPWGWRRE